LVINSPIAFPGAKLIGLVNWQHCKREELQPYLEHLSRLDLRVFFGMAKWMQENNARDLLKKISVPVLIIAGEDDIFTPWRISDEMFRTIPGAEILTIPHGSHAAIIEQPELINLRIEKFIRERLESVGVVKKSVENQEPVTKAAAKPKSRKARVS
jgi:pimeloyl-ACP methyl ester carboxylesterase